LSSSLANTSYPALWYSPNATGSDVRTCSHRAVVPHLQRERLRGEQHALGDAAPALR
jgi:hypothetical protein